MFCCLCCFKWFQWIKQEVARQSDSVFSLRYIFKQFLLFCIFRISSLAYFPIGNYINYYKHFITFHQANTSNTRSIFQSFQLSNMQLYKKLENIFLLLKMYHQSTTIMCWHNPCEIVLKQCPIFQLEVQFSTKLDNKITPHRQLISVTYCSTHSLHHVLVKLVELEHLVAEDWTWDACRNRRGFSLHYSC